MKGLLFSKGLSVNVLKIIALIAMTIDHIGVIIFPKVTVLRIIGRIAMPIFAFMIAEGCVYTKHKLRYFLLVFGLGLICVIGTYIAEKKIILNILITFSFSIAIIYAIQYTLNTKKAITIIFPLLIVAISAFTNEILPFYTGAKWLRNDYGFFGTLLPVMIYAFKDFRLKLISLIVGLTLIALTIGGEQWWAYLSLLFMIFYDGTRGKYNLKYLFYIYYPMHIVVIYGINLLI